MEKNNIRNFIGLQFFAEPADRMTQIEQRLSAIRGEIEQDGADLSALENEVNQLLEERQALTSSAEARSALLSKLGAGTIGTPVPTLTPSMPEQRQAAAYTAASPEYRTAWLQRLRNVDLTETEQRAFTTVTDSAGAVIPTDTANSILTKVKEYAPLLSKINLLHVPGMVRFAVEKTVHDAEYHAENAQISAKDDKLETIDLTAYEITKLVQVSKSVKTMSIPAFENWLVDMLARKIADKISDTILNGTGSSQGKGIEKSNVWAEENSVEVALSASLTNADVQKLIALLPGGYDARAEFLMSKKTLFMDFMPLQDKNKHDIVTVQGNSYYIYGYPVTLDERIADHEAYLADLYTVIGNLPEDITITSGFDIDTNSFKFLGCAMFDCKPSMPDAIRKLRKSDS